MDSGWIKALELPVKITGGVFAASVIIILLDRSGQISLVEIGVWVSPILIILAVLSGCLFLASVASELSMAGWKAWQKYQKNRTTEEVRQNTLKHLDRLSEQEVYMVVEALKEESPSFTSWRYSSGAAQLVDKGLLMQHQGEFLTDHWPYTFKDFAWAEIEKRRDYFLEKEKNYEEARKIRR